MCEKASEPEKECLCVRAHSDGSKCSEFVSYILIVLYAGWLVGCVRRVYDIDYLQKYNFRSSTKSK